MADKLRPFSHFFCWIFSTLIIQVLSGTIKEIDLTEKCGETYDYEIYDVSETVSYHVTFSGTSPPKRCRRGFYRGYEGKTCIEAIEYDIQDCGITLHFSSDVLKTYNCDLKPVGRICSYFGDIVRISLGTTYPRKDSYAHSSFKLLVTSGGVKEAYISDSSPATAIIIPILVIGLVIVIVFTAIACKRRQQQQQQLGLTRNLSPTTTQPQPQQTHVVVYHHVVPPQQGGGDFSSNPQQPLMSGRGQQIEIHQYPPNPQQMPLQGYGQQMTTGQFYPPNPSKQGDDKRSYGPPPSYEEAAKNLV